MSRSSPTRVPCRRRCRCRTGWQFCRIALLLASLACCQCAWAEHFNIALTVENSLDQAEGHADQSPPASGLYPRPVFHAKAGDLLTLQFFMTDVNPHDVLKQVTVRYYVAPEGYLGQKDLPPLESNTVLQGRFVLDFKPQSKAGLKQHFKITKPGTYLVRVESLNSHSDHEHFSAIDLKIE